MRDPGFFKRKRRSERELDEELRFHVERRSEELLREAAQAGTKLSAAEARRRALVELGGRQQIKEEVRAMRTGIWLETLWQDLRYAARQLRRNPGFAAVAILTLALGIGATTAIFSVVNAVLLRPLPYPDPQEMINIWEDPGDNPRNFVNPLNFADVRAQAKSFEQLAAYYGQSGSLTGAGDPERVIRGFSTPGLFSALRVQPAIGRAFLVEEERAGRGDVGLLSHGLWVRRFGADPNIIDKPITLDGQPVTIVGVLAAGMSATSVGDPAFDVWTPMPLRDLDPAYAGRGSHYFTVVGRLRDGVSLEQGRAEVHTIYERLREQHPRLARWSVHVVGMHADLVADVRQPLLVLLGAVGFLLLIACTNVANLLLARATVRQHEVAVRMAIGASRGRLVRQLLSESLLLALLGSGAGLLLAQWGTQALLALEPGNLPRLHEVQIDYGIFAFALAISLLAGTLFGLAPAVRGSRAAPAEAMKESAASVTAGRGTDVLRRSLVAVEVALSVVLLIGAGLLMKSFAQLLGVDPGFDPQNVATMRVSLPRARYAESAQQAAFFQELLGRVKTLPGVQSAAFVSDPPLTGGEGLWENGFHIEGQPEPPPGQGTYAYLRWVSEDYFRTLGIRLQRGRTLTESDTAGRAFVAVVDEAFVRRFFPGRDPIGQRIAVHWGDRQPREIVGVVNDVNPYSLSAGAAPHMYVSFHQVPRSNYGTLLMRTEIDPRAVIAAARTQVQAIDPSQPVFRAGTLNDILQSSVSDRRFHLVLLATFATTAVLLAAVGIYGVMACVVSERRREMAIRIAMGAERHDVIGLVLGQGTKVALLGVLAGVAGALGLTSLLASQLFQVRPTDPATFAAVAAGVCLLAALACSIPARRAAAVNPAEALRHE